MEKKTAALERGGQGKDQVISTTTYNEKSHTGLALVSYADEPPVVRCLVKGNDLIVARCPVCGSRHIHGRAGEAGPDFGHRLAHCCFRKKDPEREAARLRGYVLTG